MRPTRKETPQLFHVFCKPSSVSVHATGLEVFAKQGLATPAIEANIALYRFSHQVMRRSSNRRDRVGTPKISGETQ